MEVLTDRGFKLGRLHDALVDEQSGKILSLVVKPAVRGVLEGLPTDPAGNALVPFSSVMAIRDYIVINERTLAIQQIKRAPLPPEVKPGA